MARPQQKRSHEGGNGEEQFVDDLAVAAGYAVATAATTFHSAPGGEELPVNEDCKDEDEIELEVESSSEDSRKDGNDSRKLSGEAEETKMEMDEDLKEQTQDSDEDRNEDGGDESDVDLEEELQRMTEKEADEEEKGNASNAPPKTVHEIDPYQANVDRLKSEFELDVTLEEQERILNAHQQQLGVAGKIQHHMASERTIVIHSQPHGAVLEEGTLLVIRVSRPETSGEKIAPLGRILEVFGPVSQPMYSVRLPELLPDDSGKEKSEQTSTELSEESKTPSTATRDPWSTDGEYSLLLRENPSRTVFYLLDGAKVLDPGAIFKISGRGSDASNVFDEEITNPDEAEYSDDEEERSAKRRTKANKRGTGQQNAHHARGPSSRSDGGSYREASNHAPLGFHPNAAAPHGFPQQTGYAPPNVPPQYAAGAGMAYPPQGNFSGVVARPPPPPPPREECDTVYYDLS
jgi:hypothetical protein